MSGEKAQSEKTTFAKTDELSLSPGFIWWSWTESTSESCPLSSTCGLWLMLIHRQNAQM